MSSSSFLSFFYNPCLVGLRLRHGAGRMGASVPVFPPFAPNLSHRCTACPVAAYSQGFLQARKKEPLFKRSLFQCQSPCRAIPPRPRLAARHSAALPAMRAGNSNAFSAALRHGVSMTPGRRFEGFSGYPSFPPPHTFDEDSIPQLPAPCHVSWRNHFSIRPGGAPPPAARGRHTPAHIQPGAPPRPWFAIPNSAAAASGAGSLPVRGRSPALPCGGK